MSQRTDGHPISHVSSPSRPPRLSRFLVPRPQPEAQLRTRRKGCMGRRHHHGSSLGHPGVALAVRSPPHLSSWGSQQRRPSAPPARPRGLGLPLCARPPARHRQPGVLTSLSWRSAASRRAGSMVPRRASIMVLGSIAARTR